MNRADIQKVYIRVCRDSGFKMDGVQAATLAAKVIGCSPLEIWLAMPSLNVMDQIAKGDHPAAARECVPTSSSEPANPVHA